jgi:hypothetical protein
MSDITLLAGRTIAIDGAPALSVGRVVQPATGDAYLAPYQVDSIARQLAAAMAAGVIRAPSSVEDARELDCQAGTYTWGRGCGAR